MVTVSQVAMRLALLFATVALVPVLDARPCQAQGPGQQGDGDQGDPEPDGAPNGDADDTRASDDDVNAADVGAEPEDPQEAPAFDDEDDPNGLDPDGTDDDPDVTGDDEVATSADDSPTLAPLDVEELSLGNGRAGSSQPSPDDAQTRLEVGAPPSARDTEKSWATPQRPLSVHGYFRVRSELWDRFYLGRRPVPPAETDLPFSRFRPAENGVVPAGGCGNTGSADSSSNCDSKSLGFANMRLRLEPTLTLSEDVAVHMQFDVLDNVVLGSTPDGFSATFTEDGVQSTPDRSPRAPLDTLSNTQTPPSTGQNTVRDAIAVRRVWGELNNRALGQLAFGRMGWHWGLGMFVNRGDGIDSDFQTDVDRIMVSTKLAGFYLSAAFDFASEGFIQHQRGDLLNIPFDAAQDDDVTQYMFSAAKNLSVEERDEALARGDVVFNGGLQFVYRSQKLSSSGVVDPFGEREEAQNGFVRRNSQLFIPDLWLQFLYDKLRLEMEAVFVGGSIENSSNTSFSDADIDVIQFGFAFESEYRLLDDKLGLYLYMGLATGDDDVEGLVATNGYQQQVGGDDRDTTFRFHPNYRVDLILWRNIMQQVSGAYYFKPGASYDFIRSDFGQRLGFRADLIYSRASSTVQTWGNTADLGVELNASLYYRSEDGPDLMDGFYASLQYGLLFPLGGLGYLEDENGQGEFPDGNNPSLANAQAVRLILGIQF